MTPPLKASEIEECLQRVLVGDDPMEGHPQKFVDTIRTLLDERKRLVEKLKVYTACDGTVCIGPGLAKAALIESGESCNIGKQNDEASPESTKRSELGELE